MRTLNEMPKTKIGLHIVVQKCSWFNCTSMYFTYKLHNNHMPFLGFSLSVAQFVLSLGQTQDLTDCRLSNAGISLEGGKYCMSLQV